MKSDNVVAFASKRKLPTVEITGVVPVTVIVLVDGQVALELPFNQVALPTLPKNNSKNQLVRLSLGMAVQELLKELS